MGLFLLEIFAAKAAREARKSRLELERQTKETKAQTHALQQQAKAAERQYNATLDKGVKASAPEVGQFRIRVVSGQDDTSNLAKMYMGLSGQGVFAARKFVASLPKELPKTYTQADAEKVQAALQGVGATVEILTPNGDVVASAAQPSSTLSATKAPQAGSNCARCEKKFTLGFGRTVCQNPICGQTWCFDCSPGLFVHKCPACGGVCR